jgi:hypothetical protein
MRNFAALQKYDIPFEFHGITRSLLDQSDRLFHTVNRPMQDLKSEREILPMNSDACVTSGSRTLVAVRIRLAP